MTQPVFKDASMRARALFKSANSFMCKHISFTLFYIFLVLVSESISYINFLKLHPNLAEFLKTNSSFSTVPGAIFNNISPRGSWQIFAENSYVPYVLFGVQLTEAFLFFALIFWAQSLFASEIHHLYKKLFIVCRRSQKHHGCWCYCFLVTFHFILFVSNHFQLSLYLLVL